MARRKSRGSTTIQRLCRLCLLPRTLRYSHIIPEFLFKDCYDERHRMVAVDRRPERPTYQQKGWREYLLCDDCEQFLNAEYEQPMKAQWIDTPKLPAHVRTNPIIIEGVNYDTFKLFHLSVLWRAAVASTGDFAQVKLGPHEERLRQMIRTKDAGGQTRYPLFSAVLVLPQNLSPAYDVVVPTSLTTIEGQRLYQTTYSGCVWGIAVASHSLSPRWNDLMLNREGRVIATVHDFRKFWVVGSALKSFKENRQLFGWPALSTF
jgi:hypothetical protein